VKGRENFILLAVKGAQLGIGRYFRRREDAIPRNDARVHLRLQYLQTPLEGDRCGTHPVLNHYECQTCRTEGDQKRN
jgi:hypothetical protein